MNSWIISATTGTNTSKRISEGEFEETQSNAGEIP